MNSSPENFDLDAALASEVVTGADLLNSEVLAKQVRLGLAYGMSRVLLDRLEQQARESAFGYVTARQTRRPRKLMTDLWKDRANLRVVAVPAQVRPVIAYYPVSAAMRGRLVRRGDQNVAQIDLADAEKVLISLVKNDA